MRLDLLIASAVAGLHWALAGLHLDLLVAAASAGVLVYSGRLLIPAVRLRPADIIAYKIPRSSVSFTAGPDPLGGVALYRFFPEDEIRNDIRNVVDGKAGFDLLVIGTIGGVFAVIVATFTFSWNVPSGLNVAAAAVLGLLGYRAGWWVKERSDWYRNQERRLLVHCFLAWLEREVGDPRGNGRELGPAVASIALHTGFTVMDESLRTQGADVREIVWWMVDLAHRYRYAWWRPDFQKWAEEVSKSG